MACSHHPGCPQAHLYRALPLLLYVPSAYSPAARTEVSLAHLFSGDSRRMCRRLQMSASSLWLWFPSGDPLCLWQLCLRHTLPSAIMTGDLRGSNDSNSTLQSGGKIGHVTSAAALPCSESSLECLFLSPAVRRVLVGVPLPHLGRSPIVRQDLVPLSVRPPRAGDLDPLSVRPS